GKVKEFTVVPNLENKFLSEKRESFLDYISQRTTVIAKNLTIVQSAIHRNFKLAIDTFENLKSELKHASPNELFLDENEFRDGIKKFPVIKYKLSTYFNSTSEFQCNQKQQPNLNKHFELLLEKLNSRTEAGFTNFIFCSSEKQVQRCHNL